MRELDARAQPSGRMHAAKEVAGWYDIRGRNRRVTEPVIAKIGLARIGDPRLDAQPRREQAFVRVEKVDVLKRIFEARPAVGLARREDPAFEPPAKGLHVGIEARDAAERTRPETDVGIAADERNQGLFERGAGRDRVGGANRVGAGRARGEERHQRQERDQQPRRQGEGHRTKSSTERCRSQPRREGRSAPGTGKVARASSGIGRPARPA
jgi:hypothetical protein